jgi:hypothetical protein
MRPAMIQQFTRSARIDKSTEYGGLVSSGRFGWLYDGGGEL